MAAPCEVADFEAIRRIVYGARLRYFLRFWLSDDDEIEDVLQDTIVAVLSNHSPYAGRSTLWTWVSGIAIHKAYDLHRRACAHRKNCTAWRNAQGDVDETMEEDSCRRLDVWRVLGQMPEQQRDALVRRYIDDQRVSVLVRESGKCLMAVEDTLRRARAGFRRRWCAE